MKSFIETLSCDSVKYEFVLVLNKVSLSVCSSNALVFKPKTKLSRDLPWRKCNIQSSLFQKVNFLGKIRI